MGNVQNGRVRAVWNSVPERSDENSIIFIQKPVVHMCFGCGSSSAVGVIWKQHYPPSRSQLLIDHEYTA